MCPPLMRRQDWRRGALSLTHTLRVTRMSQSVGLGILIFTCAGELAEPTTVMARMGQREDTDLAGPPNSSVEILTPKGLF